MRSVFHLLRLLKTSNTPPRLADIGIMEKNMETTVVVSSVT